ncbi:hypothetical protein BOP93_12930 [Pseudomonas orientalis]|uniref:Tyr recombinase domain-containing protein n=1 Tax=Pseudomonas orientalis TaxID=76758 RepID=A0A2L0RWS1_9PSED|nr:hypothetical protein BOP93_12930 [Pseudomonas orientalis]
MYKHAEQPLRDALDLFHLTGRRIADTVKMDERDIRDNGVSVKQGKTHAKRRIEITAELKVVIDRIMARKDGSAAAFCRTKSPSLYSDRTTHLYQRSIERHLDVSRSTRRELNMSD